MYEIETDNLVLRSFTMADAEDLLQYVQEDDIANSIVPIYHPYQPGLVEKWIKSHERLSANGTAFNYAIAPINDRRTLIGYIGLENVNTAQCTGDMRFWIGRDYSNQGLMTEAATAILEFAFDKVGLNRIYATHMAKNIAAQRVLEKIGIRVREGTSAHTR